MKKLSKFIYFIFAFALITCMAIFAPAITDVQAAGSATSNKISISNSRIPKVIEAGKVDEKTGKEQELVIPMPTIGQTDATVERFIDVIDRSGVKYSYNCENKEISKNGEVVTNSKYFTLLNAAGEDVSLEKTTDKTVTKVKVTNLYKGTYQVQYRVNDKTNSKTFYSEITKVQVKGHAYSWEFNAEKTEKVIIPSVMDDEATCVLPLPKIYKQTGETSTAIKTYELADAKKDGIIRVTNSGVDVTDSVIDKSSGKLVFKPAKLAEGASDTYLVKYFSTETTLANKTFAIEVKENFNAEAKLEVTHNAITNYQVGAVVTFPNANVTDKTNNKSNVEVNNVITIKRNGEEYVTLPANDYEYKFTETGTYTIQYEVTDVYGNKATSKLTSITLSDKKPYQVSFASTYETTETDWEDKVDTDVAYMIPNEVGYNGFVLPAIYAKDYVDSYEKILEREDGTSGFSRKLVSTTDSSVWFDLDVDAADDNVHGNAAYADELADAKAKDPTVKSLYNREIRFEFPTGNDKTAKDYAGQTFKLVYTAKDTNSSNVAAKATEYTIKIADKDALTNNIDKNLIINFATINGSIDPYADLTFTTATAKEEPKDSALVADERIQVKTYYYYGNKSEITNALSKYITIVSGKNEYKEDYIEKYGYNFAEFEKALKGEITFADLETTIAIKPLESKDGKTTLNLTSTFETNKTEKFVTIFAVGINDQGQFVLSAQELGIDNTTEINPPEIEGTPDDIYTLNAETLNGATMFNQNVKVVLPGVEFKDEEDKTLRIEVSCYVDTPDQTVGVSVDNFIRDGLGKCGIDAAELTTTYAGTYYVVYTATDDAGNKVSYVSTFDVAKTERAYIEVENGSNITKNIGETVNLNIKLAGEGDYDYDPNTFATVTWGEKGPSATNSDNSFIFNEAGTYVATISVKYKLNGQEITDTPKVTVTITVVKPEMTWETGIDAILENRTANIDEIIELPVIFAIENGTEITALPKVTYLDDNKKEQSFVPDYDEEFSVYTFKADKDVVYTVKYTATTEHNSQTKSFTITCGDYYNPTISIASNKLDGSKVTFNGQDIVVNIKFNNKLDEHDDKQPGKYTLTVTAKEGDKQVFNYDIDVELKDRNASEITDFFDPDSYTFSLTGDSVTKNTTNEWKITGVGEYELKLTVKDENGNSEFKTFKFTVENKTEPKSIKDEVVGIVLIIVSVVVLGGVILFFALAGRKKKTKKRSAMIDKG